MNQAHTEQPQKPTVIGEMDDINYLFLNTDAELQRAHLSANEQRLGELAVHDGSVEAVHVFRDNEGVQQFVVSNGPNKGDTLSPRSYQKHGLSTPAEEVEKLKSREHMNSAEFSYFDAAARGLAQERSHGATKDEITTAVHRMVGSFWDSARSTYYSPEMKAAMELLSLGAHRQSGSINRTVLKAASSLNFVQKDMQSLQDVLHEIEGIKYTKYGPEKIEQGLIDAAARNIADFPEGERSDELQFLLFAYAAGLTSSDELASEEYLTRMERAREKQPAN